MSISDDDDHRAGERPPGEPALGVETVVVEESGRWFVEIIVVFADGVVRRRINDYPSQRLAEIAAGWIKRTASRDIEGPMNG